jgi:hypothetical protein
VPYKDPKANAARSRRYYAAHLETERKRNRKTIARWRRAHPIKARRAYRKWRAAHPYATRSEISKQFDRDRGARYRATPKGIASEKRKRTGVRRKKRKVVQRAHMLKHRYGMAPGDYNELLKKQNGHCAFCPQTPEQERYGVLAVDHDHKTKRVRGLLCMACNQALGKLGDNEISIRRVLAYLTKGKQHV